MKKIMIVVFVLAAFVSVCNNVFAQPFSGGVFVNPAANTIIADTGPLPEEYASWGHDWDIIACATVASVIVVEWRDATNTANVWSQILPIPAGGCSPMFTMRGAIMMQAGERIRIRINAAITGSIQGTINFFY